MLDYTPLLGEPERGDQPSNGAADAGETAGAAAVAGAPSGAQAVEPATKSFELACTVAAPVSWDGAHTFWVWRVVAV